ncbi:hypothetical protein BC829DRAFT_173693 [Chytridium lagenaria]|nr:hypothetical protein BC829DRAFT_173693 [Chytridium lagenaria]
MMGQPPPKEDSPRTIHLHSTSTIFTKAPFPKPSQSTDDDIPDLSTELPPFSISNTSQPPQTTTTINESAFLFDEPAPENLFRDDDEPDNAKSVHRIDEDDDDDDKHSIARTSPPTPSTGPHSFQSHPSHDTSNTHLQLTGNWHPNKSFGDISSILSEPDTISTSSIASSGPSHSIKLTAGSAVAPALGMWKRDEEGWKRVTMDSTSMVVTEGRRGWCWME